MTKDTKAKGPFEGAVACAQNAKQQDFADVKVMGDLQGDCEALKIITNAVTAIANNRDYNPKKRYPITNYQWNKGVLELKTSCGRRGVFASIIFKDEPRFTHAQVGQLVGLVRQRPSAKPAPQHTGNAPA